LRGIGAVVLPFLLLSGPTLCVQLQRPVSASLVASENDSRSSWSFSWLCVGSRSQLTDRRDDLPVRRVKDDHSPIASGALPDHGSGGRVDHHHSLSSRRRGRNTLGPMIVPRSPEGSDRYSRRRHDQTQCD